MQTWIKANIGKLIERFGDLNLKLITAAEFEALEDKDPNTLYIVTDSEADTVDLYLGDKKISDIIIPKTITENGTYDASADNADGYNPVTVNIPIISKTITENGTYNASSDDAAGYNPVTVNIPIISKTITENGTYNASSDDAAGYNPVTVNIPIIPKTITENGTYNASSDDAAGYNPVSVNVPQPVITTTTAAADLTGYEAGDIDLGNNWEIALGSGTAAVDSVTVGDVTYEGLAISGATTISSARTLTGSFQELEIEFIITALGSGDVRVISTGGLYFESTIWYSSSDDYLKIVLTGGTIIDTDNVIDQGSGDGHDLSLPKTGIVNTPLRIKYVSNGTHIALYINNIPKVYWAADTINDCFRGVGIHIGANGTAGSNMLVSKAEYSGRTLSWDGRTWVPV